MWKCIAWTRVLCIRFSLHLVEYNRLKRSVLLCLVVGHFGHRGRRGFNQMHPRGGGGGGHRHIYPPAANPSAGGAGPPGGTGPPGDGLSPTSGDPAAQAPPRVSNRCFVGNIDWKIRLVRCRWGFWGFFSTCTIKPAQQNVNFTICNFLLKIKIKVCVCHVI